MPLLQCTEGKCENWSMKYLSGKQQFQENNAEKNDLIVKIRKLKTFLMVAVLKVSVSRYLGFINSE